MPKSEAPDPLVQVLGAERAGWLAEAHLAVGDAAVWALRFREVAVDLARANLALRQTREILQSINVKEAK